MAFSHIRDDVSSKQETKQASKQETKQARNQASKKTDFIVDLIWWGSLRLAPIIFS